MSSRNPNLVPQQIVDANGKRTTVWVSPSPVTAKPQDRLAQRALPPRGAVAYTDEQPYTADWTPLLMAVADDAHSAVATAEKQTEGFIAALLKLFGIGNPGPGASQGNRP